MISDVDDDGCGTFEYEEFLKMMTHKIFNRDPKDEIFKAFRLFDEDKTGKNWAHPRSTRPGLLDWR